MDRPRWGTVLRPRGTAWSDGTLPRTPREPGCAPRAALLRQRPLEDRRHVRERVVEVEQLVELLRRELRGDVRVGAELVAELPSPRHACIALRCTSTYASCRGMPASTSARSTASLK